MFKIIKKQQNKIWNEWLTINTPEQLQQFGSGVIFINFMHITLLSSFLIWNIIFVACPCSATTREPSSRRNDCSWCWVREWLPHCMHGIYGKSGYRRVLVCEINLNHSRQMLPFYAPSNHQKFSRVMRREGALTWNRLKTLRTN